MCNHWRTADSSSVRVVSVTHANRFELVCGSNEVLITGQRVSARLVELLTLLTDVQVEAQSSPDR